MNPIKNVKILIWSGLMATETSNWISLYCYIVNWLITILFQKHRLLIYKAYCIIVICITPHWLYNMPINDRNLVNKQILDVKGKSVGGIKIYSVSHKVVTSKYLNYYLSFVCLSAKNDFRWTDISNSRLKPAGLDF